jgi:exopolyphosphatase / guanosine-5'-triphosphate,3'-diphosphate pyrophosphatase
MEHLLAAIDLGSNSFRLELGSFSNGFYRKQEYLKETVRQGSALDAQRNLSEASMQAGWNCISRFAERIKGFNANQVSAVATQTLREARNRDEFIAKAQKLLGYPIDVISGTEEARLIYDGVNYFLPNSDAKRLVIDIGGRSTELITGTHRRLKVGQSYRVGSVAWSGKYFADGRLEPASFERASIAAKAVLEEALIEFVPHSWSEVYGSSGTVGAVADVIEGEFGSGETISYDQLEWLKKQLLKAGSVEALALTGLKEDRKAVVGGGVSVLLALFELLDFQSMHVAQGALRHGVLLDLQSKLQPQAGQTDIRSLSINRLAKDFHVDESQTKRLRSTALAFETQLFVNHTQGTELRRRKLGWACDVAEIGFAVSHSDHHKHGAYLIANADLMGFTVNELRRLSLLILGQKGKLRKLDAELAEEELRGMLLAFRLATILCHARRDPELRHFSLKSNRDLTSFSLSCSKTWSQKFPQSWFLLKQEEEAWQRTGAKLSVDLND